MPNDGEHFTDKVDSLSSKYIAPAGGVIATLVAIFFLGPLGFQVGGVGGAIIFALVGGAFAFGIGFAIGGLLIEFAIGGLFWGALALLVWAFFHFLWGLGKPS